MASPTPARKSTGQFMRQGHTAHVYGSDPQVKAKGSITDSPKEIKPT